MPINWTNSARYANSCHTPGNTRKDPLSSLFASYLLIVPLGMGFLGVMSISTSSFNALEKPMPPLVISILQMIVVYIPMALLGDHLWGYVGIFIAGATTVTLLGAISWAWINREIEAGIARGRS